MAAGKTFVVWATLTEPNGTPLVDMLDHVSKFLRDLSFKTKCHIFAVIGYEDGENSHAHLGIAVLDEELAFFESRLPRFKPWKSWRFKHKHFVPWESGHNTFGYITGKHEPLFPGGICPKKGVCRNQDCHHTTVNLKDIVHSSI